MGITNGRFSADFHVTAWHFGRKLSDGTSNRSAPNGQVLWWSSIDRRVASTDPNVAITLNLPEGQTVAQQLACNIKGNGTATCDPITTRHPSYQPHKNLLWLQLSP
jgi:hypothetical protein